MPDSDEHTTTSLYDYTDKSVPQAGYAAIAYGVISLFSGLLAVVQFYLYHTPAKGSVLPDDFAAQQYLQHTPLATAITVVFSVIIAAISGVLAFFIFRRSRVAIIVMIGFVVVLQLYTWFVAFSLAGTVLSVVVVAFLLRGAKTMFQDYAEAQLEAKKKV